VSDLPVRALERDCCSHLFYSFSQVYGTAA
jgi:hypothetical protein